MAKQFEIIETQHAKIKVAASFRGPKTRRLGYTDYNGNFRRETVPARLNERRIDEETFITLWQVCDSIMDINWTINKLARSSTQGLKARATRLRNKGIYLKPLKFYPDDFNYRFPNEPQREH